MAAVNAVLLFAIKVRSIDHAYHCLKKNGLWLIGMPFQAILVEPNTRPIKLI